MCDPGKPFQSSLMLVRKARAYLSEALFRCSTVVYGSQPYPQTLDYVGKTCKGQTLKVIANISKLRTKFFMFSPRAQCY